MTVTWPLVSSMATCTEAGLAQPPARMAEWSSWMRYISTRTKFNAEQLGKWHNIYLARGKDHAGNVYGDPGKSYDELARYQELSGKKGH